MRLLHGQDSMSWMQNLLMHFLIMLFSTRVNLVRSAFCGNRFIMTPYFFRLFNSFQGDILNQRSRTSRSPYHNLTRKRIKTYSLNLSKSTESRDYLGACTLFLPSTVLKVAQIASEGFLGQIYVLRKSYSVSYSFRTNSGV